MRISETWIDLFQLELVGVPVGLGLALANDLYTWILYVTYSATPENLAKI